MKLTTTPKLHYSKLKDSGVIYWKIIYRLFRSMYYLDMHDARKYGSDYFSPVLMNVMANNRCFVKLFEMGEPRTALPLIRIQFDNLLYLYAETKYPDKVLPKVIQSDKQLGKIQIGKEYIKPSELIDELDGKYIGVRQIYKDYCHFIHPSGKQVKVEIPTRYKVETDEYVPTKKAIIPFQRDMLAINRAILSVLTEYLCTIYEKMKLDGYFKTFCKEIAEEEARMKEANNNYPLFINPINDQPMKQDDGYCTLQEYNELKTAIYDAIDEWQKYWDSDESVGIAINPTTHSVQVCTKDEVEEGSEWYALDTLVEEDSVLDIVDSYCFLR